MYRSFGRWLYFFARPFIALVVSRDQPRVRVEIRHGTQILLVKSWFGSQKWELPGGGVNRGEAPSRAAVREVQEETGLVLDRKKLQYLVTLPAQYPLKCDLIVYTIHSSKTELSSLKWPYKFEIMDKKWYDIDNLPDDLGSFGQTIIRREFEESS